MFRGDILADHLDLNSLVSELPDDLDTGFARDSAVLVGDPGVITLLSDGGIAFATVRRGYLKRLVELEGDHSSVKFGHGDHLPLARGDLGDLHRGSHGHGTLPVHPVEAEGLEEVIILLLRGSQVGASKLNHVDAIDLLWIVTTKSHKSLLYLLGRCMRDKQSKFELRYTIPYTTSEHVSLNHNDEQKTT